MRRVHGRICREQEVNLQLHFQHLGEEDDFKNEWVFVESRPIERASITSARVVKHLYKIISFWRTSSMAIKRLWALTAFET